MKKITLLALISIILLAQDYSCDTKKRCSEIKSCKEAMFYLKECGFKSLDRDKDGIPCENICKGTK